MPIRRTFAALLLALLLWAACPFPVQAQAVISDATVDYFFGQQIAFRARLQSDQPVLEALVVFQAEGVTATQVARTAITSQGEERYDLDYTFDLTSLPLRAFSQVTYHFEVSLEGGETYQSPAYNFYYEDNRFGWRTRNSGPFTVHWYEGDVTFAQQVLDVAASGLQRIQTLLPLADPEPVDIYVYANAAEMQATLIAASNRVAGHADPDLGVMVVALPAGPDQGVMMEQRIPHELVHILLYQATGRGYGFLPTWLNEGLASAAELYPNPDYKIMLDTAYARQGLLPVASLCQPFPRDASSALLAYAQSASFTRYLQQNFGNRGLQALVENYSSGLDCERGAQAALDVSLAQLERHWRQDVFGENAAQVAATNLAPWMLLAAAALVGPAALMLFSLRPRSASRPAPAAPRD